MQDTLLECLDDAFYHTGSVPEEIWFDNIKAVVDHSHTQLKKVQFNDRFYDFSKAAGFKPIACQPYRPQTKGSVEVLARTMERLRVYNYEFCDGVELINLIGDFCAEINHEESQVKRLTPNELWRQEALPDTLLNPYF